MLRITASGVLTDAEVIAVQSVLGAQEQLRGISKVLFDARAVEQWQVHPDTVRRVARTRDEMPHAAGGSRLALIVSDDLGFGLARMYALTGAPDERIGVFRNMEDAEAWLELSPT